MKQLFILFTFISLQVHGQYIWINEFMSKNENSITDEDNEYNDWIELHNSHNETINLNNYSLSDNEDELNKWQLPNITIAPQSSLLIFASGKDRVSSTELHTNFKISSEGESLYLSNAEEILIDYISAINLGEDDSFGRLPDGSNNLIHLEYPSPGNSNNNTSQIIFSKHAGFYNQTFNLNIQSLLGDTIYYTLDGSIPTMNSDVFTDSIFIYNRNSQPNYFSEFSTSPSQTQISYKAWESPSSQLDKANIVRCVSYKFGITTSKVYTKTYFVDEEINTKYKLPVVSLVTDGGNLFANDSGIYVPGIHFNADNPEWTGNYFKSGRDWEIPVHIEYFDEQGDLGFTQNAGLRIHGGKTRQAAQKSLRLYARNEYGKKHFNYPLFPQKENEEYKRFLLRTTMGSWADESIIKDVLAHDIASDLDLDCQDYQPVIVFINGEYWGIHTLRDRIDENYISYLHGIDKDSIDLIGGNHTIVTAGTNNHYINLLAFIEENALSESFNYEYVCTQIDIDNFIDYQISELFFANQDWPTNNMKLWRPQTQEGKWRWIFYDLDAGLGDSQYNMLNHATKNDESITWPNSPRSTFLFRHLLENQYFTQKFINRYAEILNGYFTSTSMLIKVQNIKELYADEIPSHILRWNYPYSYSRWEFDIEESLASFLEKRPCNVSSNIANFFDLANFDFDCSSILDYTNLILAPNPNAGNFFIFNDSNETIRGDLHISNTQGKIVHSINHLYLNAYEKISINLSELSNGIYMLNYSGNLFSEQHKFIKIN